MRLITRRGPLRLTSVVVLIVLAGSTLALSASVRKLAGDQQRQMLHERTAEAGVLLSTLYGSVGTTLSVLGSATNPRPGSTDAFVAAATPLTRAGAASIGVIAVSGDNTTVLAAVGDSPEMDAVASHQLAELGHRALSARSLVSAVVDDGRGRRIRFAVPTSAGMVLFEEVHAGPTQPYRAGKDDPFQELEGVLYASPREDPTAIVLTTSGRRSLTGAVDRQPVKVGADTWLIVSKSKRPLVGSFAANASWIVLAAGLLAALLTTGLVETLARRRRYALDLVEERTGALRDALQVQEQLEKGQRQAREVAEAANASKSEFLSRMSHELRTPLNAVLGFAQLLELDELNESQTESVDQILKGGRHLLDLINEVLDIARIETGALALSPEPVLVSELVADTMLLMRPLADHREVSVVVDQGPAIANHVLADRQRLKQILLNLVANAIKYNHVGGSVTVSCDDVDGKALRIAVTDDGPGIRPEDIGRLFVPFERLGAERTNVEGTGVGLALSRRLAEAMGGTIGVESVHGAGSRFYVELPLAEGPVERYERLNAATADEVADAADGAGFQRTVLYIEDNLSNVRLVERVLARFGSINMIPAMQGRLGYQLAREHRPDLILLDLHLPDIDGTNVLRLLREDAETAAIPVVVVSADATSGQVERLMTAGADAYLTKPIDVDALLTLLADTIGGTAAAVGR